MILLQHSRILTYQKPVLSCITMTEDHRFCFNSQCFQRFIYFYFIHIGVLCVCMLVPHMCVIPEEAIGRH